MLRLSKNITRNAGMYSLPRVIIAPNGDVTDITDNTYHVIEAAKIWRKLDPSKVKVLKNGFVNYLGESALYDLINQKGYIAMGTAGHQEIKANRSITNPTHPATLIARMLAKQWNRPFFEAEIGSTRPITYYVEPFIKEGKFVRKHAPDDPIDDGLLADFEQFPTDDWSKLSPREEAEKIKGYKAPEADLSSLFYTTTSPTSIKDIRKALEKEQYPDDIEMLRQLRAELKQLSKIFEKRGFYKSAKFCDTLIKKAGSPRALIAPDGSIINIPLGFYHGIEATKIWQKIDPSMIKVEDGWIQYTGDSALYDLIEKIGYIAIGSAGGQELKADKKIITNPNHPATLAARALAKQWIKQFFEAEISGLSPRIYYVNPFYKEGKFVRRDLNNGPLEDFEELPPDSEIENLYEQTQPNELFSEPQAAGDSTSIRNIRKMLDKEQYPDDIVIMRSLKAELLFIQQRKQIRTALLKLLIK